jgi:hypothetical protein
MREGQIGPDIQIGKKVGIPTNAPADDFQEPEAALEGT